MPQLFVISAPSGAGKTSLIHHLIKRNPQCKMSISHTTRPKRAQEVDAKDYYFINQKQFQTMLDGHAFVEHAIVFEHYYGTSIQALNTILNTHHALVEIDWQGMRQIKQKFPQACSVFILPPDLDTLRKRLQKRAQDTTETIAKRMNQAQLEIKHYHEYDYVIINDEFESALNALEHIICAQTYQLNLHQQSYQDHVAKLIDD